MYVNRFCYNLAFSHLSNSMNFGIIGHTLSTIDCDVGFVQLGVCVYKF